MSCIQDVIGIKIETSVIWSTSSVFFCRYNRRRFTVIRQFFSRFGFFLKFGQFVVHRLCFVFLRRRRFFFLFHQHNTAPLIERQVNEIFSAKGVVFVIRDGCDFTRQLIHTDGGENVCRVFWAAWLRQIQHKWLFFLVNWKWWQVWIDITSLGSGRMRRTVRLTQIDGILIFFAVDVSKFVNSSGFRNRVFQTVSDGC